MSTSSLERHDLEQDIDELRGSIESLESTRSRLRDVIPARSDTASGSIWSDLSAIVTDFFELAGEAMQEGEEDGDENDGIVAKTERTVKKAVTTDWSGALGAAFTRLSERVAADIGIGGASAPPTAELGDVLGELDGEIDRLNGDLQRKLDRVAEIDRAIDADDVAPVKPHHRDVRHDDRPVVNDDDDVDVTPMPVDIVPDVDPGTVVVPTDDTDDVVPTPNPPVDVTPVVDVIPTPDVVTPATDDDTTTDDKDTPAYVPGNATEIGELDGAIYDVNEILANGHTVADLRKYDVPAGVVIDAGVGAAALLDGGYTLAELHEAGVAAADLHSVAGAADMRAAGYTAADLHGTYSAGECAGAFSAHELRDAGYSLSDFHGVVSASELRDVFSVAELHSAYSVSELRSAGFDAADLNAGGVGWAELAAAGFTLSDLENAGASEGALRDIFPHELGTHDDTPE